MLPLILALAFTAVSLPQTALSAPPQILQAETLKKEIATSTVPIVPFYSQFKDITSAAWQKVGCGVASLAMIIDFYKDDTVSVNTLLTQGIAENAYLKNAGWSHKGLIQLSNKYGLGGKSYDLSKLSTKASFAEFKNQLKSGPVIASVHYKFDPKSTIPHLVVIDGIVGDTIYYNDPAAKTGQKQISTTDFLKAWKKKFIVIRPAQEPSKIVKKAGDKEFATAMAKL
ncbi:C39 family peptidase [Candidatus Parcubacteria bacterium]|nr:C39 family peptidase [Candidatus Parcubacteria bacterium]